MSLPKWIEETDVKGPFGRNVCFDCGQLKEALAIAVEALEKIKVSHNDGILKCREKALEALRRIEELGQNTKKAECICGKQNCEGHPEGRFP